MRFGTLVAVQRSGKAGIVMTQARLIKRTEATDRKPTRRQTTNLPVCAVVKEWMAQYRETKPRNARATFAALFAEPQLG